MLFALFNAAEHNGWTQNINRVFFMSNLNSFVLWLLQHNFTKTNKRKGGKGGKLYTYTLMHLNFSHWIKKTDTDTYLLMGEPLCLAFSFCNTLMSHFQLILFKLYSRRNRMGAIFCQRIIVGCRQMSPNCPFGFFERSCVSRCAFQKGGHY